MNKANHMNATTFPKEYQQVMPYLILPDPGAFLQFSTEVLGATERMVNRDEDGTYRHCEVAVGDAVIMFSIVMAGFPAQPAGLFVYVRDADAAYKRALELGAKSIMPVGDQPYGRSGGVLDTNGNTWWLTTAL
jgi:PhnB protein